MVDSLDSGSSVHCGRAGSSPASPTRDALEAKIRDNSEEGMAVRSLFAVISYFFALNAQLGLCFLRFKNAGYQG